jgi:hypothetical protein
MPPSPESTHGMKRWKTEELAPPSLTTSNSLARSTPALVAVVTASAISAAVPWLRKLLISFILCPEPIGPT